MYGKHIPMIEPRAYKMLSVITAYLHQLSVPLLLVTNLTQMCFHV